MAAGVSDRLRLWSMEDAVALLGTREAPSVPEPNMNVRMKFS